MGDVACQPQRETLLSVAQGALPQWSLLRERSCPLLLVRHWKSVGLLEPKPCVLALVLGVRGGVQEGHFGTGSGKGSARALSGTARGRKISRGDSATHK